MELKEFIKQTLVDIASGINEAQEEFEKLNACINPTHYYKYNNEYNIAYKGDLPVPVQEIQFEVGLTNSTGGGKEGGLGVVLGQFSIGGKSNTTENKEAITKIKFSVPVVFPISK